MIELTDREKFILNDLLNEEKALWNGHIEVPASYIEELDKIQEKLDIKSANRKLIERNNSNETLTLGGLTPA